jgi:hypothetical protein
MPWPGAVRHEDGGEAGRHGGGGAGVELRAGELVVTPDDTRLNRIFDLEKALTGGRGHSTPADGKGGCKIFRGFPLGAGLRSGSPREESASNRTGISSVFRSLGRLARREVTAAPARQELIAAAHARDGVEPVLGGVPCRGCWFYSVDRHARTASAPRLVGKSDYNNELGAKAAETSVRSL